MSIVQDFARRGIVQTHQQLRQCSFACTVVADNGDFLAFFDSQIDSVKGILWHIFFLFAVVLFVFVFRGLIRECDILQFNGFQRFCSYIAADNLRFIGEKLQILTDVLGIVGHPDEVPCQIVHTPVQLPDDVDGRHETAERSRAVIELEQKQDNREKLRGDGNHVFQNGQEILLFAVLHFLLDNAGYAVGVDFIQIFTGFADSEFLGVIRQVIYPVDVGIFPVKGLDTFVFLKRDLVAQSPHGSIERAADQQNQTDKDIHLHHQRDQRGQRDQIIDDPRCIVQHLYRASLGFVHRPDVVVVELRVVIAGEIHFQRVTEQFRVHSVLQLLVGDGLVILVVPCVEQVDAHIHAENKEDVSRNLSEGDVRQVKCIEQLVGKDCLDGA